MVGQSLGGGGGHSLGQAVGERVPSGCHGVNLQCIRLEDRTFSRHVRLVVMNQSGKCGLNPIEISGGGEREKLQAKGRGGGWRKEEVERVRATRGEEERRGREDDKD